MNNTSISFILDTAILLEAKMDVKIMACHSSWIFFNLGKSGNLNKLFEELRTANIFCNAATLLGQEIFQQNPGRKVDICGGM